MNSKAVLTLASLAVAASFGAHAGAPGASSAAGHWTPDASVESAFPALTAGAGATNQAKVRTPVRAPAADVQRLSVNHWTPDARSADAFPALRELPATSSSTRAQVRAELTSPLVSAASVREGA